MNAPRAQMRLAIAARVSTVDQERDGTSLDTQAEKGRLLAQLHTMRVPEDCIYSGDESGTLPPEHRPILQRMLADARARTFDAVCFTKIDRIARRLRYILEIWDAFDELGVTVYVIDPPIDSGNAWGRAIRNILATLAELEVELLNERTSGGRVRKMDRQADNEPWLAQAKYGFTYIPKASREEGAGKIGIDPAQADVVRRMFALRARGMSHERIALLLTDEGVRNPTGGPVWWQATVARIMRDPAYKGSGQWGRTEAYRRSNGKRSKRLRTDGAQPVEVDYPRIVDDDLWAAANAGARCTTMRGGLDRYLLAGGLVHCAEHAHTMTGSASGSGHRSYRCWRLDADGHRRSHVVPAQALEDAVWREVTSFLLDAERGLAAARRLAADAEEDVESLAQRNREIDAAVAELDRQAAYIVRHGAASGASGPALQMAIDAIAGERQTLYTERAQVRARIALAQQARASAADVEAVCRELRAGVSSADASEKRALLDDLQVQVSMTGYDYEIRGVVPEMCVRGTLGVQGALTPACGRGVHGTPFLLAGRLRAA